jgi:CRISPR-associated protein Cas1
LSLSIGQLVIKLPAVEKNDELPELIKKGSVTTIPIEDIGVVLLDHQQITITQGLVNALLENNVALITCDNSHHPLGLMFPLAGNKLQSERFKYQTEASVPLKKQLWQQTVSAKILNQARLLKSRGIEVDNMYYWSSNVKSGDTENYESRAAVYFWKTIFPPQMEFTRSREGDPPNNILNYGYSILRAIVARGLVSSGLLPTLGIFHRNKYNAYCLADDIMEPYRPYVDQIVLEIIDSNENIDEVTTSIKRKLLEIPTRTIRIGGEVSPLMVGLQRTTASLYKCFEGSSKKIIYPEFE